ncbi:MAG: polymerase subunit sigma-70 [Thermoleophilia bacterium]|nr:polymerase subunit sigma-70 [Thermoleophilia bacterium]
MLLSRYVNAWEQVDIEALVALVREDAVLRMPPQPHVHGPADILDFLLGRADIRTLRVAPTFANGRPALVLHRIGAAAAGEDHPHGVLVLEPSADGSSIAALDAYIGTDHVTAFT